MKTKICPHCRDNGNPEPQPLSAFNLRDGKPRSWCRSCEQGYSEEYRNRSDVRAARAIYSRDYERTELGRAARQRVVVQRIADGREFTRGRRKELRRKYAIELTEYDSLMFEQSGRCAICRDLPSKRLLAVDHDHVSGKVRGLCCDRCNIALGLFYDDRARLFATLQYLDRPLPLIDRSRSYPVKGLRDEQLRDHYNITQDSFNELLRRQGNACAICKGQPHENSRGFHVDHIHGTKDIRGILCNSCNVGIGYFRENITIIAAAIWYLHKAQRLEVAA